MFPFKLFDPPKAVIQVESVRLFVTYKTYHRSLGGTLEIVECYLWIVLQWRLKRTPNTNECPNLSDGGCQPVELSTNCSRTALTRQQSQTVSGTSRTRSTSAFLILSFENLGPYQVLRNSGRYRTRPVNCMRQFTKFTTRNRKRFSRHTAKAAMCLVNLRMRVDDHLVESSDSLTVHKVRSW